MGVNDVFACTDEHNTHNIQHHQIHRHGNLIKFMHNTIPLVAHGDDNLHVTLHEASEGILVARYQCTTVGTYRMSVIEPTSGQPIPASPLTVEVHAAAPSPLHTRVRLPEGPLVGEPLVATVQYRDAYGNGTTVPEGGVGLVEVHAAGPAPLEMVAQEGKGLVGTPSVAGVYTLVATMQGVTLPGIWMVNNDNHVSTHVTLIPYNNTIAPSPTQRLAHEHHSASIPCAPRTPPRAYAHCRSDMRTTMPHHGAAL